MAALEDILFDALVDEKLCLELTFCLLCRYVSVRVRVCVVGGVSGAAAQYHFDSLTAQPSCTGCIPGTDKQVSFGFSVISLLCVREAFRSYVCQQFLRQICFLETSIDATVLAAASPRCRDDEGGWKVRN